MKKYSKMGSILMVAALVTVSVTVGVVLSQSDNGKYDTDGDGLIEVSNLEQLNAIRYDLDGDGRSSSEAYGNAFPADSGEIVCQTSCHGYELARSLDFGNPGSYSSGRVNAAWTSGSGWLPIGIGDNPFTATLDGNGHTISNLYIQRLTDLDDPGQTGLFGIGQSATIRNLRLTNVDLTGRGMIGGIAGWSNGSTLKSISVTGQMEALGSYSGPVGGLVGESQGVITDGSFEGNITCGPSACSLGGLVGSHDGAISNSRADVIAIAPGCGYGNVGGLVGYGGGAMDGCSSSGKVSGCAYVGGLAGGFIGTLRNYLKTLSCRCRRYQIRAQASWIRPM